jgi:glutamate-1-semialdehyde 2,1-aminomutase
MSPMQFIGKLRASFDPIGRVRSRLLLSRAKHPSLAGHARIASAFSRLMPTVEYDERDFFVTDDAPPEIAEQRKAGMMRLSATLRSRAPETLRASADLESSLSDVAFVNTYRVPFPYQRYAKQHLPVGCIAAETDGPRIRDLDGNWSYDLSGDYGVNLFGHEFYKRAIDRGVDRARSLGLVLGQYHPIIADNVARLKELSGLDEISFHMSGTEAVMQAVRLARYHSRRSHLVRFCGAYHGWWDGVQPGPGNPRPPHEVYTLKEMDELTLRVLRTRTDIACVLVNPIQAMHPNKQPPNDSTLLSSSRSAHFDRAAYTRWLHELARVCRERDIAIIFDEVFLGFRLARGGAQEYFGVRADLVTYGKSLGGGLPVGVVCGRRDLMRRFREDRPADVCFARGTFNSHPYVMATMNEFLRHLDESEVRERYATQDATWQHRADRWNARLAELRVPVRVANMVSVFTTLYTVPSRYNWMFQYYLRAEGLSLAWIGSARMILPHDLSDGEFDEIVRRFGAAAQAMQRDGWWWESPELSDKSIQRRLLRDLVGARLGLPRGD